MVEAKRQDGDAQLTIDIDADLRRRIEVGAAEQNVSVRDYVVSILRRTLEATDRGEPSSDEAAWGQLSTRSFARDWASDEDRVYDRLP